MKNIVSTIIVFGSIFILIVAGAFIFDKFNGFGLIDDVDSSLNSGIKKVLENEEKNTVESNYIKDNVSGSAKDNISDNLTITADDNVSNTDNQSDNLTIDNERILNDNQTLDNNTPSDNTTDGMYI